MPRAGRAQPVFQYAKPPRTLLPVCSSGPASAMRCTAGLVVVSHQQAAKAVSVPKYQLEDSQDRLFSRQGAAELGALRGLSDHARRIEQAVGKPQSCEPIQ